MHGITEGIKWYKRALYSIRPSTWADRNALIFLLCKIASGYTALKYVW